jgi:threonine/homoserine/homoserine lactone efflux protein
VHVLPFLALATLVVVTPGVDMALVTRNALVHGRRAALLTAAGVNVGILLWVCAAALGLAALLAASATAFTVVKLAGAAYLVFLGLRAVLARERAAPASGVRAAPRDLLAFRQGLINNALNPKIAVFFTSVLPQFAGAHPSAGALIVLGLIFSAIGWAWLLAYALIAASGREVLGRARVRKTLSRLTGMVLVGLGVRLALERRP